MSIETLDLDSDCLSRPTRLDLALIESHMLWPAEKKLRDQAMVTSTAEFGSQLLPILPDEFVREHLVPLALHATPLQATQELASEPFMHGVIAGMILDHIVGEVAVDPSSEKASMGWIIESLSKMVYPRWRLAPKTIENSVWPKYRKVSPYWAAYVHLSYSGSGCTFPCRLNHLTEFLSTSEAFRVAGERTRTKRSPRPVLLSGECIGLPALSGLPVVALSFAAA